MPRALYRTGVLLFLCVPFLVDAATLKESFGELRGTTTLVDEKTNTLIEGTDKIHDFVSIPNKLKGARDCIIFAIPTIKAGATVAERIPWFQDAAGKLKTSLDAAKVSIEQATAGVPVAAKAAEPYLQQVETAQDSIGEFKDKVDLFRQTTFDAEAVLDQIDAILGFGASFGSVQELLINIIKEAFDQSSAIALDAVYANTQEFFDLWEVTNKLNNFLQNDPDVQSVIAAVDQYQDANGGGYVDQYSDGGGGVVQVALLSTANLVNRLLSSAQTVSEAAVSSAMDSALKAVVTTDDAIMQAKANLEDEAKNRMIRPTVRIFGRFFVILSAGNSPVQVPTETLVELLQEPLIAARDEFLLATQAEIESLFGFGEERYEAVKDLVDATGFKGVDPKTILPRARTAMQDMVMTKLKTEVLEVVNEAYFKGKAQSMANEVLQNVVQDCLLDQTQSVGKCFLAALESEARKVFREIKTEISALARGLVETFPEAVVNAAADEFGIDQAAVVDLMNHLAETAENMGWGVDVALSGAGAAEWGRDFGNTCLYRLEQSLEKIADRVADGVKNTKLGGAVIAGAELAFKLRKVLEEAKQEADELREEARKRTEGGAWKAALVSGAKTLVMTTVVETMQEAAEKMATDAVTQMKDTVSTAIAAEVEKYLVDELTLAVDIAEKIRTQFQANMTRAWTNVLQVNMRERVKVIYEEVKTGLTEWALQFPESEIERAMAAGHSFDLDARLWPLGTLLSKSNEAAKSLATPLQASVDAVDAVVQLEAVKAYENAVGDSLDTLDGLCDAMTYAETVFGYLEDFMDTEHCFDMGKILDLLPFDQCMGYASATYCLEDYWPGPGTKCITPNDLFDTPICVVPRDLLVIDGFSGDWNLCDYIDCPGRTCIAAKDVLNMGKAALQAATDALGDPFGRIVAGLLNEIAPDMPTFPELPPFPKITLPEAPTFDVPGIRANTEWVIFVDGWMDEGIDILAQKATGSVLAGIRTELKTRFTLTIEIDSEDAEAMEKAEKAVAIAVASALKLPEETVTVELTVNAARRAQELTANVKIKVDDDDYAAPPIASVKDAMARDDFSATLASEINSAAEKQGLMLWTSTGGGATVTQLQAAEIEETVFVPVGAGYDGIDGESVVMVEDDDDGSSAPIGAIVGGVVGGVAVLGIAAFAATKMRSKGQDAGVDVSEHGMAAPHAVGNIVTAPTKAGMDPVKAATELTAVGIDPAPAESRGKDGPAEPAAPAVRMPSGVPAQMGFDPARAPSGAPSAGMGMGSSFRGAPSGGIGMSNSFGAPVQMGFDPARLPSGAPSVGGGFIGTPSLGGSPFVGMGMGQDSFRAPSQGFMPVQSSGSAHHFPVGGQA